MSLGKDPNPASRRGLLKAAGLGAASLASAGGIAQAAGNADAFRRAAHSLKSNSNTFGATQLGLMARDLELGGLVADAAPVDALEAAYQAAAAALLERTRG